MKVFSTEDIRNVALIGHGGSGKTSLTSAFLFAAGCTKRLGSVDDGTAPTDFDEEEVQRKISLQTSLAQFEWKQKKINLLDTPGFAAFVADAQTALTAVDAAVMVVESISGVQVVTERTFGYAEQAELPVMFVVNRLDRENSSFQQALESIQERFGRTAVPVQLPIGAETNISGVVDLVGNKAYTFDAESGKASGTDVPGDMADAVSEARAALVEMVAETDDALMEKFFESGDLTEEELTAGLRAAFVSRKLFPVYCSAATHTLGAATLLDAFVSLIPAPHEKGEIVGMQPDGEAEVRRAIASDQPTVLQVFKTVADPFAGKLSLFRVHTGTLKGDTNLVNASRGSSSERMASPSVAVGKQMTSIGELRAGDMGVVAKLKETQTGDTLCDPAEPLRFPELDLPEPSISYAVEPKSKGDEEKISGALARLMEEDPMLRVQRDPQTGELLVSGTGQMHVEVTLSKMKRKFGVEAILHPPKVPYLETIRKKVENVEGKHKKQSGGRGQFGVCVINIEPLPRGSGFEFVDKIFGGAIPQNYRPAVQKGIKEAAEHGWQAGCPVVDFRITLIDGKYHNVDSSEMAFKIAGSKAFQEAMEKAGPTILEPLMAVEITAPEDCMGDIMGDLSQRRGKPQGMEAQGHYQVIKAQVPMSEMLDYGSALKSLTSDRASYHMEFDHYAEAPSHVREKIVAEVAKKKEEKAG